MRRLSLDRLAEREQTFSRKQSFNHHLTLHSQDLVGNKVIELTGSRQSPFPLDNGLAARRLLPQLRTTDAALELAAVERAVASTACAELVLTRLDGRRLRRVEDVSALKDGRAADQLWQLYCGVVDVSIKTHKNNLIALAGYGQTSLLTMAQRCYGYSLGELAELAAECLGRELEDVLADEVASAELAKWMLIERLDLAGFAVLDQRVWFPAGTYARDEAGARRLLRAIARGVRGPDQADILLIDRRHGQIGWAAPPILDVNLRSAQLLERLSFGPSRGCALSVYWDGRKLFEHQVHGRRSGVTTRVIANPQRRCQRLAPEGRRSSAPTPRPPRRSAASAGRRRYEQARQQAFPAGVPAGLSPRAVNAVVVRRQLGRMGR